MQKACECAGSENDGPLLITLAETVEKELRKGGDIFAALTQRRKSEANGGEPEGEIGDKCSLRGQLAERDMGRRDDNGAAGRAILQGFEDS